MFSRFLFIFSAYGAGTLVTYAAVDRDLVKTAVAVIAAGIVVPMVTEWRHARRQKYREIVEQKTQEKLERALAAYAVQAAQIEALKLKVEDLNDRNGKLAMAFLAQEGHVVGSARLTTPAPPRKTRVLLVEDHPGSRRAMETLLNRDGFQPESVGTLAAALQAVEEKDFDVILLDLGLPDGSGTEVIRAVRNMRSNTRVVVTTGLKNYDVDALDPDAVLEKPVNPDELFRAVRGE